MVVRLIPAIAQNEANKRLESVKLSGVEPDG